MDPMVALALAAAISLGSASHAGSACLSLASDRAVDAPVKAFPGFSGCSAWPQPAQSPSRLTPLRPIHQQLGEWLAGGAGNYDDDDDCVDNDSPHRPFSLCVSEAFDAIPSTRSHAHRLPLRPSRIHS